MENSVPGLKKAMAKAGVTQNDLASKLGVASITISRWVRGEIEPSISVVREIATIVGCTVQEILGLEIPSIDGCRIESVQDRNGNKVLTVVVGKKKLSGVTEKTIHDRISAREDFLIAEAQKYAEEYRSLELKAKCANGNTNPLNFDKERCKKENADFLIELRNKQEEAEMRYGEITDEYYKQNGRDLLELCDRRITEHTDEIVKISDSDYDVSDLWHWTNMDEDEVREREIKKLRWWIEEAKYLRRLIMIDCIISEYRLHFDEEGKLAASKDPNDNDLKFVKDNYQDIVTYLSEGEDFKEKSKRFEAYRKLIELMDELKERPYYAKKAHYKAVELIEGTSDPEIILSVCEGWAKEHDD